MQAHFTCINTMFLKAQVLSLDRKLSLLSAGHSLPHETRGELDVLGLPGQPGHTMGSLCPRGSAIAALVLPSLRRGVAERLD